MKPTGVRALIVFCDMKNTTSGDFPAIYAPMVNLEEQVMLERIDQKSEGECDDTAAQGPFECICHYLGRPAYYHNEKTFNEWIEENPGSGDPAATRMARSHLTWENYGKWDTDYIPKKLFDSSDHSVKVDTRYIYTIFLRFI